VQKNETGYPRRLAFGSPTDVIHECPYIASVRGR